MKKRKKQVFCEQLRAYPKINFDEQERACAKR